MCSLCASIVAPQVHSAWPDIVALHCRNCEENSAYRATSAPESSPREVKSMRPQACGTLSKEGRCTVAFVERITGGIVDAFSPGFDLCAVLKDDQRVAGNGSVGIVVTNIAVDFVSGFTLRDAIVVPCDRPAHCRIRILKAAKVLVENPVTGAHTRFAGTTCDENYRWDYRPKTHLYSCTRFDNSTPKGHLEGSPREFYENRPQRWGLRCNRPPAPFTLRLGRVVDAARW